jgi:hypothetical protein
MLFGGCAYFFFLPLLKADDNEILRLLLSKSELVVLAKVEKAKAVWWDEAGVINHGYIVTVVDDIKSAKSVGKKLSVTVIRFELEEADELSYLKEGATCIFFLKRSGTSVSELDGKAADVWVSVDFWFGVQPGFRLMADDLREIVKEEQRNKKSRNERKGAEVGN